MYVCICHGLSETDIRAAVARGVRTFEELSALTGCGTCCGCCRETARALLAEGGEDILACARLACAA